MMLFMCACPYCLLTAVVKGAVHGDRPTLVRQLLQSTVDGDLWDSDFDEAETLAAWLKCAHSRSHARGAGDC